MIKYVLLVACVIAGASSGPSTTENTMRPAEYPALFFRRTRRNFLGEGPQNPLQCVDDGNENSYEAKCYEKYGPDVWSEKLARKIINEIRKFQQVFYQLSDANRNYELNNG